ncbi:MAG: hypothetical protein ABIQ93_03770 [Saprospiraceae bacterium]
MPTRFLILLLFSLCVSLSTNSARACGHSGICGQAGAGKSCCAVKGATKQAACAKMGGDQKKDRAAQKCPGSRSQGGCHCPCALMGGAPVSAAIEAFPPLLSNLFASEDATLRQAFYYARHRPEAVYLAIWQPPQLG